MKAGILIIGLTTLGAGCVTAPRSAPSETVARFYLESSQPGAVMITLPLSQVNIAIESKPVITEFDVVNVEIVEVELGRCLAFQLTGAAARDVYRMTVVHQSRRLVLMVNGEAMGVRRIEQPIANGVVLVFVEMPDAALPELAAKLRTTAVGRQHAVQKS